MFFQTIDSSDYNYLCQQVLAFFIRNARPGGRLTQATEPLQALISTFGAVAIPVWSSASVPDSWNMPCSKTETKPDTAITTFVRDFITVPRYRRLVEDLHRVWKSVVKLTATTTVMKVNSSSCAVANQREVTEEETIIAANIIRAAPGEIDNAHSNEGVLVSNALASIILFIRGPGKEIYTTNAPMIGLRTEFQNLMQPFIAENARYTFPDGMNSPQMISSSEQKARADAVHRRAVQATLESCVRDVAHINWSLIVGPNGQPIPSISGVIRDFLTVFRSLLYSCSVVV